MTKHEPYITTYKPISGWKAVMIGWDEEIEWSVPEDTSYFAYETEQEAIDYAEQWAKDAEIEYRPRVAA